MKLQDHQGEQGWRSLGVEMSGNVRVHDLPPIADGVLRDVDDLILGDQNVGDSLAAQEEYQQQEGFEGELATREYASRSDVS